MVCKITSTKRADVSSEAALPCSLSVNLRYGLLSPALSSRGGEGEPVAGSLPQCMILGTLPLRVNLPSRRPHLSTRTAPCPSRQPFALARGRTEQEQEQEHSPQPSPLRRGRTAFGTRGE